MRMHPDSANRVTAPTTFNPNNNDIKLRRENTYELRGLNTSMRDNINDSVRKVGKTSEGDQIMEVTGRVLQKNPLIVGDENDSIRVDGFHPMTYGRGAVISVRGVVNNSAIQASDFTVINHQ